MRIEHRGERRIIDLDQLGGILGDIAALGDDERHRLADIAHALDGERPLRHRRLHRGEKRIGELAHLLAGDHRPYPMGMHLARLEMRVLVNAVLDRLPGLRLDPGGDDTHIHGLLFRSPPNLPVLFDPA